MGIANSRGDRTLLERFLGLFANVRGGEGITVLLLVLDVFLLLLAYYIIKPVREALILAGGGAEVKSYLFPQVQVLAAGWCFSTTISSARGWI